MSDLWRTLRLLAKQGGGPECEEVLTKLKAHFPDAEPCLNSALDVLRAETAAEEAGPPTSPEEEEEIMEVAKSAYRQIETLRQPPKRHYRTPAPAAEALDRLLLEKGFRPMGGRGTVRTVIRLAERGVLSGGEILEALGLGRRTPIADMPAEGSNG